MRPDIMEQARAIAAAREELQQRFVALEGRVTALPWDLTRVEAICRAICASGTIKRLLGLDG